MIRIAVRGARSSPADWDAVRALPPDQLPPLTPQQRETARTLGIREDDYARSAYAGKLGQEKLLKKTEFFARLLNDRIRARNPQAILERVELDTWTGKFEVTVGLDGVVYPLRVDEDIVDQLFERGSDDADRAISRIIELLIPVRMAS